MNDVSRLQEFCEFILGLLLNLYSMNCTIYFAKIPCTYLPVNPRVFSEPKCCDPSAAPKLPDIK